MSQEDNTYYELQTYNKQEDNVYDVPVLNADPVPVKATAKTVTGKKCDHNDRIRKLKLIIRLLIVAVIVNFIFLLGFGATYAYFETKNRALSGLPSSEGSGAAINIMGPPGPAGPPGPPGTDGEWNLAYVAEVRLL